MSVSHPLRVTRIVRFTVRRYSDVPVRAELCQAPDAPRAEPC